MTHSFDTLKRPADGLKRRALLCICLGTAGIGAAPLSAQTAENRSAQASRSQIEAALAEAEKIVASPGYSGRVRGAKQREITLLKSRLEEGDLQSGDQVILSVQGDTALTKVFAVGAGRLLTLPGIGDISLRGVLRSEVEEYLTASIRKFLRDPIVHAQTTVRLSLLGSVVRPGFYPLASELIVGDAIMAAGGPVAGIDPAKTKVERAGVEIMSKESFAQALTDGKTLDQLNLRAGDEILVGGRRSAPGGPSFLTIALPLVTSVLTLTLLVTRSF